MLGHEPQIARLLHCEHTAALLVPPAGRRRPHLAQQCRVPRRKRRIGLAHLHLRARVEPPRLTARPGLTDFHGRSASGAPRSNRNGQALDVLRVVGEHIDSVRSDDDRVGVAEAANGVRVEARLIVNTMPGSISVWSPTSRNGASWLRSSISGAARRRRQYGSRSFSLSSAEPRRPRRRRSDRLGAARRTRPPAPRPCGRTGGASRRWPARPSVPVPARVVTPDRAGRLGDEDVASFGETRCCGRPRAPRRSSAPSGRGSRPHTPFADYCWPVYAGRAPRASPASPRARPGGSPRPRSRQAGGCTRAPAWRLPPAVVSRISSTPPRSCAPSFVR